MSYRWIFHPCDAAQADALSRELSISPLLARCLINRDLHAQTDIDTFLKPRLKNLADPFLLPNMRSAVDRIFHAHERGERIVIFGDYDVDGVASTALLLEVLGSFGCQVSAYLPHRRDEGYGLSRDALEKCIERHKPQLLLAVDCGSTSNDSINWLNSQKIDVLVLDHHQISNPPPSALAIVNPHLDSTGSSRELCSAGLAFKLAHALAKRGRELNLDAAHKLQLKLLLDLVALATIADMVPLTGENRLMVAAGLQHLSETQRPGLEALKQIAGLAGAIKTQQVSFQLAPRLNAAGRLETANDSLELLRSASIELARKIAQGLDEQNRRRQTIEREISVELAAAVRKRHNPATDFVIIEGDHSWHIGVVGIVASRIQKEFYRPTIIFGGDGDSWRGSGRSIDGFNLAAALHQCGDLLMHHGGHAMAAGLSIIPENVPAFRERMNALIARAFSREQFAPPLRLDAEISLTDVNHHTVAHLVQMEPTGLGNPAAQFATRHLRLTAPPFRMGREGKHAKIQVTDGAVTHEAVMWSCADTPQLGETFDLAYVPEINEYRGRQTVQLRVLDWKRSVA